MTGKCAVCITIPSAAAGANEGLYHHIVFRKVPSLADVRRVTEEIAVGLIQRGVEADGRTTNYVFFTAEFGISLIIIV